MKIFMVKIKYFKYIVVFKGSKCIGFNEDWNRNFNFKTTKFKVGEFNCDVVRGFLERFTYFEAVFILLNDMIELFDSINQKKKVVFSGVFIFINFFLAFIRCKKNYFNNKIREV
jgi:hypothetical protein